MGFDLTCPPKLKVWLRSMYSVAGGPAIGAAGDYLKSCWDAKSFTLHGFDLHQMFTAAVVTGLAAVLFHWQNKPTQSGSTPTAQ